MTWPVMLGMRELAPTRSEPEAQRNAINLSLTLWKFNVTSPGVSDGATQSGSSLDSQVL